MSSSKQQRGCCLSNSCLRKRNLFLAQPRHTSFRELGEQRRDPQGRRRQEQQGQTPGTALAWITAHAQAFPTDFGTRKGGGGALWTIFPEPWMRGMLVGRTVSCGINSGRGPFHIKKNETRLAAARLDARSPGFNLQHNTGCKQWCIPVIPASPWWRQEDQRFKVITGYIVSSKPAYAS